MTDHPEALDHIELALQFAAADKTEQYATAPGHMVNYIESLAEETERLRAELAEAKKLPEFVCVPHESAACSQCVDDLRKAESESRRLAERVAELEKHKRPE